MKKPRQFIIISEILFPNVSIANSKGKNSSRISHPIDIKKNIFQLLNIK
jgi:hypothetical protein